MNRELHDLLYALFSDQRPSVAQAARAATVEHHEFCQSLYDLARLLVENDAAEAAEVVCTGLEWTVERSELQGILGERWHRAGQIERALACFDAAEASARSE